MDFLNSIHLPLLFIIIGINWILHFIVNAKKRQKKGQSYKVTGKTVVAEVGSLGIVVLISLAETLLITFLYNWIVSI